MKCRYGVSIFVEREAFDGTRYVPNLYGCGESGYGTNGTLAEVRAEAELRCKARTRLASVFETRVFYELYEFCTVCNARGIKPGCIRKKCEACMGSGRAPSVEVFA